MRMIRRMTGALAIAVALVQGLSGCASVQPAPPYPTKAVRVVIPYPVGNTVDVFGRVVTDKLAQMWGQPVIVENRPGIASVDAVAKAPADGYTLLVHGMPFALDAALFENLPYSPEKDFAAVAPFASQPFALVAAPSLGVRSVAELVALAKARPGGLSYASYGPTNQLYFLAEQLKQQTGIAAGNVTVPGLVEGNAAVAQGRVGFWLPPIAGAMAGIREGKLIALAVTGGARSPMLPQVPTLEEAGVGNMRNASAWFGMWAPAGVPSALVDKLSADVARALESPDVREKLVKAGATPLNMSPADFARFVRSQIGVSRQFVKDLGVAPQRYVAPAR